MMLAFILIPICSTAIWVIATAMLVAYFQPNHTVTGRWTRTEIKCAIGGMIPVLILWGMLWII